jgi:5-oxoprolinase (ATP-hydrolysing)
MTSWQEGSDPAAAFAAAYQREFGFVLDRPVVVDDVRVRATGRAADLPHLQVGVC